jgi:hypothetical protein
MKQFSLAQKNMKICKSPIGHNKKQLLRHPPSFPPPQNVTHMAHIMANRWEELFGYWPAGKN